MSKIRTPAAKLPFGSLMLLDWLCERGVDGRMVATSAHLSGSSSTLIEVDPAGKHGLRRIHPGSDATMLDRLGGREVTDLRVLEGYGLHRFQRMTFEGSARRLPQPIPEARLRAVLERHGPDAFGYNDNVYLPSPETIALWETEVRAEAERRRDERAAREAATRRIVVIKARFDNGLSLPPEIRDSLPAGFRFPLVVPAADRPYAIAEVRRETAGRLYLGRVERLRASGGLFHGDPIRGNEPNRYVEREQVMADGVTREQALALAQVYEEDAAGRAHAQAQLAESLAGALREWDLRRRQKDAELADLVAEALGEAPGASPKP